MKKGIIFLPFLLLVFLVQTACGSDWTERKLGRVIVKADRAARQKKWTRAIKYGEQVFLGTQDLNQPDDARYINLLRNLNRYYDKANRLSEVAGRVKEAYILSQKHLGTTHETTMMSRTLYYKILIFHKNYKDALPLVLENISILKKNEADDYKRHHYLTQLYSLYKMTGQFKKEERTLLKLLELDKDIYDISETENIKIILDLAENYCRQKKNAQFKQLIKTYKLKYAC